MLTKEKIDAAFKRLVNRPVTPDLEYWRCPNCKVGGTRAAGIDRHCPLCKAEVPAIGYLALDEFTGE